MINFNQYYERATPRRVASLTNPPRIIKINILCYAITLPIISLFQSITKY